MQQSELIANRMKEDGKSYFANENISAYLTPETLIELKAEIEEKVQAFLKSLVIDTDNDHNTVGTAHRLAKMYVDEVFKGRYQPAPDVTVFPNYRNLDEIYTLGPIEFKSACSHHMVEIEGQAWVGIIPGSSLIGISKIARLVDWIARRPQIQEEAVVMIADELETILVPKALAVVIRAKHHCMTWRGVEQPSTNMITSVVRGLFKEDHAAKAEFFELIKAQGF